MFFFTVKQSIIQRASLWFIAQELAVRLHMGLHLVSVLLFLKRLYLDYLHAISKEEMYGKRNSCKACASEKQILQTSGLKKIHAPKIFHPPSGYL